MRNVLSALVLLWTVSHGSDAVVHHRSPTDGFHSVSLGENDELRVVLQANPSTGYSWEPHFNDKVLELKSSSCVYPSTTAENLVGQPCEMELWFVGVAARQKADLTLSYRRNWEDSPALHSVTLSVASLAPYRGTRSFAPASTPLPRHVDPEGSSAVPRPRPHAQASTVNLPPYYDPRSLPGFPPVKNQGSCGGCWAFATVGMLETALSKAFQSAFSLSEQYLISCDVDQKGCTGGSFAHTYHYTQAPLNTTGPTELASGAVLTSQYPYTSAKGVTGSCASGRRHVVRLSGGQVNPTTTDAMIMQMVYQNHAIGITMDSTGSLFQTYNAATVLTLTSPTLTHAVVLVGYNTLANPPYWILRNSWGSAWGDQGYAYIRMGSVAFSQNYVTFQPCSVQILDPTGNGLADIYDVKGLSSGFPYYTGRATGQQLYALPVTGGLWCVSSTLGSSDCKASFADMAVTAEMITAPALIGGVSYNTVVALCYVCNSVQISGASTKSLNAIYDVKGTAMGRPTYLSRSGTGTVLYFVNTASYGQWCMGAAVGGPCSAYFSDLALSADQIKSTRLYQGSVSNVVTLACAGGYAPVSITTCASFTGSCPAGQVLTYYSNKNCASPPCGTSDCCVPAPTCGSFTCPSKWTLRNASVVCSSAVCSPQECCSAACSTLTTCSTCSLNSACKWCGSSCVAASATTCATPARCSTANVSCSTFTNSCPVGLYLKPSLNCTGTPCLASDCCVAAVSVQVNATGTLGAQINGIYDAVAMSMSKPYYLARGATAKYLYWLSSAWRFGPDYTVSSAWASNSVDTSYTADTIVWSGIQILPLVANPTCSNPSVVACPSGYTAKDLSTPCTSLPCAQSDCCTPNPTCGSASVSCPSGYTAKASSTVCATQSCQQSDCCTANPTCSSFTCPSGTTAKATSTVCATLSCYQSDCCTPNPTCGAMTCPSGYTAKGPATVCASQSCGQSDCCTPNPTCTSFTCPSGTTALATSTVCATLSCFQSDCCIPNPTCGTASIACPSGTTACSGSTPCATQSCAQSDCCVANPTCTSFTCPSGTTALATSTVCASLSCYQSDCCIPNPTCGSASVSCPSGYTAKASSTVCATQSCQQSDCCTANPTCASSGYKCPSGTTARATSTVCAALSCYQSDCCTANPTCGSASVSCPSGYTAKASSTVCATQSCQQSDCCTVNPTCGNYRCPDKYTAKAKSTICASSVCVQSDCCTAR